MDLYLMRHASAESVGSGRVREDADRPLRADGRSDAARVGRKLREMEVSFGGMGSSPLMRAAQTAEIIAAATGYEGRIDCVPFLARPGAWVEEIPRLLDAPRPGREASLALVGHNPDLGDIVTSLLGLPDGSFVFRTGGVVHLRIGSGERTARLGFWLDPMALSVHRQI